MALCAPALNSAALGSVGEPLIMMILPAEALSPTAVTRAVPWSSPTLWLSKETYASTGPWASRSYATTLTPASWAFCTDDWIDLASTASRIRTWLPLVRAVSTWVCWVVASWLAL